LKFSSRDGMGILLGATLRIISAELIIEEAFEPSEF
jgi:hypothetical protein